jgi:hypothetical protein
MIYLASPYTHKDSTRVERRYLDTVWVMSLLLKQGLMVYSPIVHCHVIVNNHNMPTDAKFWESYNEHFLSLCTELFVYKLLDWDVSYGVSWEIKYAQEHNIPIKFIEYNGEFSCQ